MSKKERKYFLCPVSQVIRKMTHFGENLNNQNRLSETHDYRKLMTARYILIKTLHLICPLYDSLDILTF